MSSHRPTTTRTAIALVSIGVAVLLASCGQEQSSAPDATPTSTTTVSVNTMPSTTAPTSTSPSTTSHSPTSTKNDQDAHEHEDDDPFVPLTSADAPAAARVATSFITATLATEKSRQQWAADAGKLATKDFADELALTDPANIPAQKITGPARMVDLRMTGTQMSIFVPTSAQGYTVEVARDGKQIKVSHAEPGTTPPQ